MYKFSTETKSKITYEGGWQEGGEGGGGGEGGVVSEQPSVQGPQHLPGPRRKTRGKKSDVKSTTGTTKLNER